MYRRIISFLVVVAIGLCCIPVVVYAETDYSDLALLPGNSSADPPYAGPVYEIPTFPDTYYSGVSLFDIYWATKDIADSILDTLDDWGITEPLNQAKYCSAGDKNTFGLIKYHVWSISYSIGAGELVCLWCQTPKSQVDALFRELYFGYCSDLPDGLEATDEGVTAYGSGYYLESAPYDLSNKFWSGVDLYQVFNYGYSYNSSLMYLSGMSGKFYSLIGGYHF